jgi:hypothetical protein
MYILVGTEGDSCVSAVKAALTQQGHAVNIDPNPLGSSGRLRWRFDSAVSSVEYASVLAPQEFTEPLEGLFVRRFGGLQDTSNWLKADLEYMHSEGMAALFAWLHILECPVVGRCSEDAWYRPQRPLPEWVSLLAACNLPTPRLMVTNVAEMKQLEAAWAGRCSYQTLTSRRCYPIQGADWEELLKVMRHVPACLTEPVDSPMDTVTLVCGKVFWANPRVPYRENLEPGIRRMADRLQSDFIQLHYTVTTEGPKFTTVSLEPMLELHESADQVAIADRIAHRLLRSDVPKPTCLQPLNAEERS